METTEIKRIFAEISHCRENTGSTSKITNWPAYEGYTREKPKLSASGDHHSCSSATHTVTAANLLAAMSISKAWQMRSLVEFFPATETRQGWPLNKPQHLSAEGSGWKVAPRGTGTCSESSSWAEACQLSWEVGPDEKEAEKKLFFNHSDWNPLFFSSY